MMAELRSLFRSAPEPVPVQQGDVAWSESQLYTGDFPKYNPDDLIGRKGFKIYRKMMIDEQVKAVVKFKRDAITSRDFLFKLEDDRVPEEEAKRRVQLYENMIDQMCGSFNDGLNYIMSAMYQGFSLTEQMHDVIDYDGRPYIGLTKLNPKPYDTFKFKIDDYGNIDEALQEMNGQEQVIDLAKFVYFTHNPEFDQHYGQSELREAYRSWYSKDVVIRLYNQFLERFAGGFVVAQPTDGMTLTSGTKEFNAIQAAINNIRAQSSVLFPEKMSLEVHQPKTTDQFEKAIVMHDLQIAKALLVPNLIGVTHQGDTGSYSQASTQLEAFLWTLDADAKRLKDALNEQVFHPLSLLNFADGIGPTIQFKPVSEQKKFDVIKVWADLVGKSAVEVTDTDEVHLRELLEFPEKGEPVKNPIPPALVPGAVPPGDDDDTKKPPVDEDDGEGETVMGVPSGQLVSTMARTNAMKRVAFQVIDRKGRDIETEHTEKIESQLAAMAAGLIQVIEDNKLGTPAGGVEAVEKLDFAKPDKTKVRKAIDKSLQAAWNLGFKHSKDEISIAQGESLKADMDRIDEMASEWLRANGFRMLGNLSSDMLKIVQGVLMNGLKYSWATREIVNKIYDGWTTGGFLTAETNTSATGRSADELAEILQGAGTTPHRVNTAVRTNAFEAINEARYATYTDPSLDGFVEAMEYSAILDNRTTDICLHLDGRVYPANSDEWNSIRPPNHHNCRSLLVPVTIVDTAVEGKDKQKGSRWSKPPTKEPQKGFGSEAG